METNPRLLLRCARRLSAAAALALLLSGAAWPDTDLTGWMLHQKNADDLVKARKFDDALDQFSAAYLDLKDDKLDLSPNAMQLYIDYKHALRAAGMNAEADAMAAALVGLKPRIRDLVIRKCNAGIQLLSASDFQNSIDNLEKAVRLDPAYSPARQNLTIAYNNYGLKKAGQSPKASMPLFRKALLIDPDNMISRQNLAGVWRMAGKNPSIFSERVTTGDALLKEGDCIGAYVEYSEALNLKADPAVKAKLLSVPATDPLFIALKIPEGEAVLAPASVRGDLPEHPRNRLPDGANDPDSDSRPPSGDEQKKAIISSLEAGIAKAREYFQQKKKSAVADALLKQASENKEKAIELIAQVDGIASGARVKDSFNKAVEALGKDPNSETDLLSLANEQKGKRDYQGSIFVLKQVETPGEQAKRELRSVYALSIARDLGKETERGVNNPPYILYARSENLSDVILAEFPISAFGTAGSATYIPPAIDLGAFIEAAPSRPSQDDAKKTSSIAPLEGTDGKLPDGLDVDAELAKLSTVLEKNSGDDSARVKQSIMLVQYGNTLNEEGSWRKAADKYREAIYIHPANTAAAIKLSECLKQHEIDPSNPGKRLDLFNELYESKMREQALSELREYGKLMSEDGPSQALLGMCMLQDYSHSTEGYRTLIGSLAKGWPADAYKLRSAAHLVISRLLKRDAEAARKSANKTRLYEDLERISIQLRHAALIDPKNSEAVDGFLEIAREAVRLNNNANNQLLLGGAYLLKGNRRSAEQSYARALTQKPYDQAVRRAYDQFKSVTK